VSAQPLKVVINGSGGAAAADQALEDNVRAAFAKLGRDVDIELADAESIRNRCREAVGRGDQNIIVGGGDGSISLAASELADSGTALGLLPLGTLNHFARDLGVGLTLDEAAATIVANHVRQVDLAEMNGRIFVNNSAIGLYPLMVFDREAQQKRLGRSKRLAMAVASARTLLRFHHQRLTLRINGKSAQVDTPLLFVGNNDYRLELPQAGQRDRLDDGCLCVLVMRSKTRLGFAGAVARALLGRSRKDEMVRIDGVGHLRVDSRRGHLRVSLDGEIERLAPPLEYRIRKGALKVLAPA